MMQRQKLKLYIWNLIQKFQEETEMKKRILSIVLTLCIVLSIVPVTVFAANTDATELKNLMAKGGKGFPPNQQ